MRRIVFSLLLAAAACACAQPNLPHFETRGGNPTRLVVDAHAAHEYASREERVEIPFGQRESGTRLVLALMHLAQERGALWVSDLEFLQVFKWKGQLVECSTRVALADAQEASTPAAPAQAPAVDTTADDTPTYRTSVEAPEPELLQVKLGEDVVRCDRSSESRMVWRQKYDSTYNVEVPHMIQFDMPMEKVIQVLWSSHCHLEHVIHEVSRWDFQVKLEWTPPDWQLIDKDWSTEALGDARPRCYRTSTRETGNPPRHRMRARLYFRGNFRDNGRTPLPSTPAIGFRDSNPPGMPGSINVVGK